MRKSLFTLFAVLLVTITAYAASSPTPPWFHALAGNVFLSDANSAQEGNFVTKHARFFFDYAADGGTSGTYSLGVKLPARAVILRTYFKTITSFTDSGSTTVSFKCEDHENIYVAKDITGGIANAFYPGVATGTDATIQRAIGADCEIKAAVDGASNNFLTAGKLIGYITYFIEE